jgi:peptidoglycan hydrolase-like protein with peptidoglycan-binding domain
MFLVGKAAWAGFLIVMLATTRISVPHQTPLALAGDFSEAVNPNDVRKVQQILRDKEHYRGDIDGVLGLRTRASIRGFQKAENLTVTGQLDAQTAGKLGIRLEAREATDSELMNGKPSAAIKWAKGSRRPQTLRKGGKTIAASDRNSAKRENPLPSDNNHAQ